MSDAGYEYLPVWRVKTFLLRTNDPISGSVARDRVLNSFMTGKEVNGVKSQVIVEKKGFLLFIDTVIYLE